MTDNTIDAVAEPTPISAAPSYFGPPAVWMPIDIQYWEDETETHFVAEVNASGITNAALAWLVSAERTNGEIARLLAPRVRNWNVAMFDPEIGDWAAAPDPATDGELAFWKTVAPVAVLGACRAGVLNVAMARTDLQKKELRPSESGPAIPNANDSADGSATTKKSRHSPKASTTA